MNQEILTDSQRKLLPLLSTFSKDFGFVGGTAIAFQIGHRQSIAFDLFTTKKFSNGKIRNILVEEGKIERAIRDEKDQYELIFNDVRLTFLYYPFKILFSEEIEQIKMPDLLTLAAMKAYTLGRRAKWKDYVDLYFIMKDYYSTNEIIKKAKQLYGNEFSEKNFRIQLAYHKDIDFSEKVIFMPNFMVKDKVIKEKLIEFSLN